MNKLKAKSAKRKVKVQSLKFLVLIFSFTFFALHFALPCFAQQSDDIEFSLDITSNTIPLPQIFKPNIDLSGRGQYKDYIKPQELAAGEVLESWQKDIGFNGLYRMQYSLWQIYQLAKDVDTQNKLLANYEAVIKRITDAGGTVILDIFGTPAGMGKILDKKSPPQDLKSFKALIKGLMRNLSFVKKYNIWYEVWNAPDLDTFFIGKTQEYLNLYRAVAEAAQELEGETKVHIPIGGPSVSWWFQSLDGNTIATPERSLIYELIKFCYRYHLPLDFISWHAYSTSPSTEKEKTIYKKGAINLIRDWLTYFNFDKRVSLIVDEWNYDRDANLLPERDEKSFIAASLIPSRLKNMYEAGIDYQLFFSLEDFKNIHEGVVRNVGIFTFDSESSEYKGYPKAIYGAFRMLASLGNELYPVKLNDDFAGVIATKGSESLAVLIYNYIDPEIVMSYLSENIATLNPAERKILLNLLGSGKIDKFMLGDIDIAKLRVTAKMKSLLKKAKALNDRAKEFSSKPRNFSFTLKNLKDDSLYQRYALDSSCSSNCNFVPVEEKQISAAETYQEKLALSPYSLNLIVIKKKPPEPEITTAQEEKPLEASSAGQEAIKATQEAAAPEKPSDATGVKTQDK